MCLSRKTLMLIFVMLATIGIVLSFGVAYAVDFVVLELDGFEEAQNFGSITLRMNLPIRQGRWDSIDSSSSRVHGGELKAVGYENNSGSNGDFLKIKTSDRERWCVAIYEYDGKYYDALISDENGEIEYEKLTRKCISSIEVRGIEHPVGGLIYVKHLKAGTEYTIDERH